VLVALAAPFAAAQAPPEVVSRIIAESAPEKSRVMDHLARLCLDIGPRLTGSQRLIEACEFAAETFKGYGLQARLEQWDTVEVGFDRGVHSGFAFYSEAPPEAPAGEAGRPARRRGAGEKGRRLTFNTDAWTPGTDGLKHGLLLLVPKEESELEALREKAKGAWLFRGKESLPARKLDDFVLATGAYGVVSNGGDLLLTAGRLRTKWDQLPKVVRIALWIEDHKFLEERLAAGPVHAAFDVRNYFRKGPIPLYNVIAELKGTEKPEELVIVGGHIDSWDGAQGTTDNGTGTATTIEAARLLTAAGAKPKRTIRFMLWSGEEQGLLGSRAYIAAHPEENDRISAVLVHDGGTNYVSGLPATPAMMEDLKTACAPLFTLNPALPFALREVRRLPAGIGSDHDSYVQVGVPGFFWDQAGRANYTYTHHTQHDVYAAAIPEYQRHTAAAVAIAALGVANLPRLLDRTTAGGPEAPNPMSARRRLGAQFDESLSVVSVVEGGRGHAAGLREGDRILKVDGRVVGDAGALSTELNAGENKKKITVRRGATELELAVEFAR
jgi:hypothetical protein